MLSNASVAFWAALLQASQTLASPTSAPTSSLSPAYPVLADVESAKYTYDINATLSNLERRLGQRTCSMYNIATLRTARAMQGFYYNATGHYDGGEAWTDVVCFLSLFCYLVFGMDADGRLYNRTQWRI